MRRTMAFFIILAFLAINALIAPLVNASLIDQINRTFREVHGRNPTAAEWTYWAQRVQSRDKTTYSALFGAISYQHAHRGIVNGAITKVTSTSPASASFKTDKKAYPSPHNPNFLPDGTLVKSPTKPEVFYIQNGKKSWILPNILDRWLGENHYFKQGIIITVTDADLARYPQTSSVNPLYVGKVLLHPNGTKYYIDDKLRKRPLSDSVRKVLKFPSGNLYSTTAAHLNEFKTGPAITRTDMYPGGMVVYSGPFHGGKIWRIEEGAGGKITKRLYLSDYFYEADGYPDESQRAPVDDTMLARHTRGANIATYKDGWLVGISNNIFVTQGGKLRRIGSPSLFAAMGYSNANVLTRHPEFLKLIPQDTPISAFKTIVTDGVTTAIVPAPTPSMANNLTRVRPHIRALINEINDLLLITFDRDVTTTENKFWVDYVYQGEVNNRADLIAAMQTAKEIGRNPARTPRDTPVSLDKLKFHWFPYLFYYTHQKEPSEDDQEYWYSRIKEGDRDTINKLGSTIQWLKDTSGATRR